MLRKKNNIKKIQLCLTDILCLDAHEVTPKALSEYSIGPVHFKKNYSNSSIDFTLDGGDLLYVLEVIKLINYRVFTINGLKRVAFRVSAPGIDYTEDVCLETSRKLNGKLYLNPRTSVELILVKLLAKTSYLSYLQQENLRVSVKFFNQFPEVDEFLSTCVISVS